MLGIGRLFIAKDKGLTRLQGTLQHAQCYS